MRRGCTIIESLHASDKLCDTIRHNKKVIYVIVTCGQLWRKDGAFNEKWEIGILKIERHEVPITSDDPRGMKCVGNCADLLQDCESPGIDQSELVNKDVSLIFEDLTFEVLYDELNLRVAVD